MVYNKKCIYNFRLLYLYINFHITLLIIMGFINLGFIYNKNTISLYIKSFNMTCPIKTIIA